MDGVRQDLRLAARGFKAQPGFTAVAVLILALGIGANTAIYTLVDAVALRALPVARPAELYRLGDDNSCCVKSGLQRDFSLFSYPLFQWLRDRTPEFSDMIGFQVQVTGFSVRRAGDASAARPSSGEFVTANYFTMLKVPAAVGRTLVPSDDRPDATPVAVMSYRAWQQRLGLDPSVVGATFNFNGRPVTVVGVASPGFIGETLRTDPPDFWVPIGAEPGLRGSSSILASAGQHWLYAIGRLRPTATASAAEGHATAALREWLQTQDLTAQERSEIGDQHIVVTPGGAGVSVWRTRYASALGVLAVVSALVLLIACANLANLLLARVQPFQFALRAALGASRARLIRQTLAVGVLLSVAGGAAGLVVSYVAVRAIVALAFRGADFVPIDAAPSLVVLAFATGASLLTGIVLSAAPAWIMSRANPIDALRGAGRSTADRSALPRQGLVVLQVAVSLVLLVGAGLLTESLRRLEHQAFGFQTDGRLMVKIDPSLAGYTPDRLPALYAQLQDRTLQLPGVIQASLSQYSPMEGNNWSSYVSVEGRPLDPAHRDFSSWLRIGPHYFETIGTQLVRGRVIDERDTAGSRHVAVVNQAFVRKIFGGANPLGRHLGRGGTSHAMDYEIVGVVEDAKYLQATEPAFPTFFLPFFQVVPYQDASDVSAQTRSLYIHDVELHVAGAPAAFEGGVRRVIASVDPDLTVLGVVGFEEQVARNFNQQRLIARLTALYGQLALLLAAVGLYGVTAQYVARRTAEIGIRMALGADRRRVLATVLRRALTQTALGLALGIPAALLSARALSSLLYDVTSHDPWVLAGAVGVLLASAVAAALIPARRAASLDPIKALRAE